MREIKVQQWQYYFLLIRYYLLIIFLIKFLCKNKNKISNKKGFPVKSGKEVLLKGVPFKEIMQIKCSVACSTHHCRPYVECCHPKRA